MYPYKADKHCPWHYRLKQGSVPPKTTVYAEQGWPILPLKKLLLSLLTFRPNPFKVDHWPTLNQEFRVTNHEIRQTNMSVCHAWLPTQSCMADYKYTVTRDKIYCVLYNFMQVNMGMHWQHYFTRSWKCTDSKKIFCICNNDNASERIKIVAV